MKSTQQDPDGRPHSFGKGDHNISLERSQRESLCHYPHLWLFSSILVIPMLFNAPVMIANNGDKRTLSPTPKNKGRGDGRNQSHDGDKHSVWRSGTENCVKFCHSNGVMC